jgi:EAL and modified HD-GYP domain-containing signal transduction protein
VVAGAFQLQPGDLSGGQKILVNFGRRTILDKAPYALPSGKTVVQVDEGILLDDALLDALDALKAEGYQIAVNGFQARPEAAPLLELADMAIVDVLGRTPESLAPVLEPLTRRKIAAMARKVEDEAAFSAAKQLGFTLFQGYFFKKPEIVAGRRLASNEIARLKLLRLTQSDQPDEEALTKAIRSDVSLTYRLLSYLNSPLHGQRMEQLSIQRAVMYLGWTQLRHWLRVIALTDISPPGKAGELAFLSLQRARFFELVAKGLGAKGLGQDPQQVENLFTLGLFSLLDAMLQSPMEELLGNLPLDERVKEALLVRTGPDAPWLGMAQCFEQGDWAGLERALTALGIPAELAAESYSQAMEFAASFTRMSS